jgi:hypothetical protein
MHTIKIRVHRVDGSIQDIDGTAAHLVRYRICTEAGMTGKALLDAAITDDWGAPPSFVVVSITTDSGMPYSRSHIYA